ncbi:TetR family transcriptional regulator C-terminal domain-containing protein [Nocardia sp. NPDC052112]|uniref:TetR/AcrR family transcriptional regulator n=1 Tax=Nocardia sp. NPDC052112 TaxID=3155646 RepID=UPI00342BE786
MPRIVDHDQRRAELAAAVWKIVAEEGVAALTVRRVGDVAGWSGGAVQYYFPTKTALLKHAFDLVAAKTAARFAEVAESSTPETMLRDTIMALLPTTPQISAESEIWFAFLGLALGDPALRASAEKGHGDIVLALRKRVAAAQEAGVIDTRHDVDDVTVGLLALCDGICVQELYRPWDLSVARIERIVDERFAELAPAHRRSEPVHAN